MIKRLACGEIFIQLRIIRNICISFLESLNQIHRETRKRLRQQEQASKKISHQKNDMISILSIEKTKK